MALPVQIFPRSLSFLPLERYLLPFNPVEFRDVDNWQLPVLGWLTGISPNVTLKCAQSVERPAQEESMRARLRLLGLGLLLAIGSAWLAMSSQADLVAQGSNTGVITGVVTSEKGPEAGVWVIAETDELGTKFRKIVVTNDQGKFALPELPKVSYKVWVRGYGLVDSKPLVAKTGLDLKLTTMVAKDAREAAQIYPASYWQSLMEPPKASEFPGTGPAGNGISPQLKTRDEWVDNMKECLRCHQVGTKWTREVPEGQYATTLAAYDERTRMGQRGAEMSSFMSRFGRQRGLQMFADWSDHIAAGEVPPTPPRPKGVERSVVLTEWEWTNNMGKIHDEVSTDKRNPRLNAGGPIYGAEIANDHLAMLDPVTNEAAMLQIPTIADRSKMTAAYAQTGYSPSRLSDLDRFNPASIHSPMMDSKGRVWYTAQLRPPADQPAWCKEGSDNKYAQWFPLNRAGRNVSFFDPKTRKFTMIDTCFGTHHLQFASDADETLYLGNPGGAVYAWIDTKKFDETGNGQLAQGWCPTVVDSNGDGKITKPWNEPSTTRATAFDEDLPEVVYKTFDPKLDTRVLVGAYGIIVNPHDGSIWGAQEGYPGRIMRVTIGNNPPQTCKAEVFEPPSERLGFPPDSDKSGFMPRGIDVDRNGLIWTALSGSSQMASFDYSKCKTMGGPLAYIGRQCKEGWTLYPLPGPTYKGTNRRSDYYYYNWVDQFNTLGLGADTPIATGTGSDSLIALLPKTGEAVVMRVPYPVGGFHPRGMDGRIDNPKTGWKGRAVYSSTGADTVWHSEGGLGVDKDQKYTSISKPILVKFQIRPDPLAQ